jgi:hypothetical protein
VALEISVCDVLAEEKDGIILYLWSNKISIA